MLKKETVIFLLIFLSGAFLRFYQLTKIPPLMHYDEASFAYNAWSILKTGKDEFGNFLPANFRAFDDWRPPVYTYATAATFFLFGVNDLAVRLPSVLAGILLIVVFYLFIKDFIGQKIALFAVFLLAFNPTLIIFSRTAYDSNLALFFTLLTFFFFWKAVKFKKAFWLIGSLFPASLSFLSYQASKVFVPLMLLVLILIYRQNLKKLLNSVKKILLLAFFALVSSLPVLLSTFEPNNLFRFESISIFGQEKILKTSINRLLLNRHLGLSFLNPFANRRVLFFQEAFLHYLDNFNPGFLFAPKMESSLSFLPNFAIFHFFEIIPFLIGLFIIVRKLEKREKIILVSWLFLAPLPTAFLATEAKITRILPIIPIMILIISFGINRLWQKSPFLVSITYSLSLIYLLYSLFVLLPVENRQVWLGNYQQMVENAYQVKDQYEKIYVSNSLEKPYIFFLWFGKYDPILYLNRSRTRGGDGMNPEDEFENFVFRRFSPEIFAREKNYLYIGKPQDFLQNTKPFKKIDCHQEDKESCLWFVDKI